MLFKIGLYYLLSEGLWKLYTALHYACKSYGPRQSEARCNIAEGAYTHSPYLSSYTSGATA